MNEVEADLSNYVGELLREQVVQEPARLYHYTSIEGFIGIVSSLRLFLSDMMATTDQSEVSHGVGVVRGVLQGFRGDPIADSFLDSFGKGALWWGLGEHIFVHAICFCEQGDVLTQWRAYSPGGGVAIGVKFSELMDRATRGEFALGRMIYAAGAQRDMIQRMFERGRGHFDGLRRILRSSSRQVADKQAIDEFLIVVSQRLLMLALFFKHPAFVSEQEWRILKIEAADTSKSLKFRGRNGAILPYVELNFEPAIIEEVRCSPGHWPRSGLHGIRRLARSLSVPVTQSDLPL